MNGEVVISGGILRARCAVASCLNPVKLGNIDVAVSVQPQSGGGMSIVVIVMFLILRTKLYKIKLLFFVILV